MSSVECVKHGVSDCLSCCYDLAYERGRADERAATVRYLNVWADSVRDNEAIDGRLQALVSTTHASNIQQGEHVSRGSHVATHGERK